ncbi:pentatricopeptide repeat-containing protein At3g28660-like [Selaginella moellendorffii]|nr:pentatricopeptide repeat-containing protein At3g28660-like [Selaginella moellendorffii]|eukprot:XP_024543940.1 pentatricopeptide repeat-containing protein At3g28660-like [Selaginella moellendorffii]
MVPKFGVTPSIEHFHCMVDMLGRANSLEEAVSMVSSMPFRASSVSWMTVLDGCRKWKNVEVGKLAFESLLELDKRDCGKKQQREKRMIEWIGTEEQQRMKHSQVDVFLFTSNLRCIEQPRERRAPRSAGNY